MKSKGGSPAAVTDAPLRRPYISFLFRCSPKPFLDTWFGKSKNPAGQFFSKLVFKRRTEKMISRMSFENPGCRKTAPCDFQR